MTSIVYFVVQTFYFVHSVRSRACIVVHASYAKGRIAALHFHEHTMRRVQKSTNITLFISHMYCLLS